MERIVPYLWFNKDAKEAVGFYTSLFKDSEITLVQKLAGTPAGEEAATYEFSLAGQLFGAINGGPLAEFNPSTSLLVNCDNAEEVNELWDKLIDGGNALTPLQTTPFSILYGWVEDKYGLSWQLVLEEKEASDFKIHPQLVFSGPVVGKAKEAMTYYTEIFKGGKIEETYEYEMGGSNLSQASISHARFKLFEMEFLAADNDKMVDYTFNQSFSLMVRCVTQAEIDYYWEKLSAEPEAEQCGWVKDKYGISWQIIPEALNELLTTGTQKQINAVTEAFLPMTKIDIDILERVWEMADE